MDQVKGDLPDDAQDPMIIEMNMDSMPSISYSVSTTDGTDALAFVKQDVVPELEALSSGGAGNRIWRSGTVHKGRT